MFLVRYQSPGVTPEIPLTMPRPAGICGCIGSVVTGILADKNYQRFSQRLGYTSDNQVRTGPHDFPFEKARLQIVFPLAAVVIICLLLYGWMLQRQVPLSVLLVIQGVQGFCGTGLISILSTLLTDLNPTRPATASAASNMVRCWLGAGAVAALDHMLLSMGFGWCFSFMGLLLMALVPLLWLEYVYGLEWRTSS
jgi:MFS family permease